MAPPHIQQLTAGLPYNLRMSIDGYIDAVSYALPEIQKEARVEIEGDREDQFLLVVAIRRIWSAVNTQYWVMNDCLEIASLASARITPDSAFAVRGFRIGRDEISADSGPVLQSRRLRKELAELIGELEISHLVQETSSLSELAQRMFAEAA